MSRKAVGLMVLVLILAGCGGHDLTQCAGPFQSLAPPPVSPGGQQHTSSLRSTGLPAIR